MLKNIPAELRNRPQWVCGTKSTIKDQDKVPINAETGLAASPTSSKTWNSFDTAVEGSRSPSHPHIGFVLSADDPYTIIDLDDPFNPEKNWSDEKRHSLASLNKKIMGTFQSYTEYSQSKTGVHIIIKGKIPRGVNRDTVEIYSSQRYMICTGSVIKDLPIVKCQSALDVLYFEMSSMIKKVDLQEVDQTLTDKAIVLMATEADNGTKFTSLYNDGNMTGYPSQSEADLALMSILAFYTESNEQVRRIFRSTLLGARTKANKNDTYLNYTLKKIRSNQPPKVDLSALMKRVRNVAPVAPVETLKRFETKPGYRFPPGLVGEIADYIYRSSVRPVPEIGLIAALGLMAGLVGRQYNISGTGLNQYLIFLAKTGTGKEGIANGVDRLFAEVRKTVPMIDMFRGPSAFASGPALVKTMSDKPVFLSILGEFGLTLQELCNPKASSAQITLRHAFLDLYQKSGWYSMLRASVYSDKEKNTNDVQAPALTILGESTPSTFLESLGEHHIADGLIPRFTMLEYTGDRPYLNEGHGFAPSDDLITNLVDLVTIVLTMQTNSVHVDVSMDVEATEISNEFEKWTTDIINASHQPILTQLWNRAHLKVLKLSALIAVGCAYNKPLITKQIIDWAMEFVKKDISTLLTRFEQGDVGSGESKQLVDLKRTINNYYKAKPKAQYKKFHNGAVISHGYIAPRLSNMVSYKNDAKGPTFVLKLMLGVLITNGELVELPAPQAKSQFQTTSKLYALGDEWVSPTEK